MWNKLLLAVLLVLSTSTGYAENWLGENRSDVLAEIKTQVASVVVEQQTDSEVVLQGEVKDERGRMFEVRYRFTFTENGVCDLYELITDVQEYWANKYLEFVDFNEGEGNGNSIEVDGVRIDEIYTFEDFTLSFKIQESKLHILHQIIPESL